MAIDRVVELRQYTLHPGRRDDLVEVFDRRFIEGQEDVGITVLGQFRDLDRPDRFVWLRSFPDLEARRVALEGFYGGPVWAAHREIANDTMMSWDDVLLLRPVPLPSRIIDDARSGDANAGANRAGAVSPTGDGARPHSLTSNSLISIDIHHFACPVEDETANVIANGVEPVLAAAGGTPLALLVTEPGPNSYPLLPVREGEQVLVRVARFDSEHAHAAFRDRLAQSARWRDVEVELGARLAGPTQTLRLQPTARSGWH